MSSWAVDVDLLSKEHEERGLRSGGPAEHASYLSEDREGHSIVTTELLDLPIRSRFLLAELVGREGENLQSSLMISFVKLDELVVVLVRVATLTCDIHYQEQ